MSDLEYIVVFEDSKYKNFLPLSYTMPIFLLKHGIMSTLNRIINFFTDKKIFLLTRGYLSKSTQIETQYPCNDIKGIPADEYVIFINGRLTNPEGLESIIDRGNAKKEEAIFNQDNLLYLIVQLKRVKEFCDEENNKINDLFLRNDLIEIVKSWKIEERYLDIECANYPWDLIYDNSDRIVKDYNNTIKHGSIEGKIDTGVQLYNDKNIYVGKNSTVMSGCVIIAEEGPVIIDEGARVMPNSVIYGPCYIGKKSLIKVGATIYEGTTIGEVCKVGGEVEESIIHSYSNKQHYGFLGHSYIGRWCNLGAGTSNSDLKNNYSNIKMRIGDEVIDTGKVFMGMLMGDHSKTAINTSINTGTVVGVMCNIFVRDFPDKYIPSFSWVGKTTERYDFNKALQTARRVMARRDKKLTNEDIDVLKYIYEESFKENKK